MKKLLFVLSLSLSACHLLNDNVRVSADQVRMIVYDKHGDLQDSMTYNKEVSLEIDLSNRCIKVESVIYPDVVYRISDLQYDAEKSDDWMKYSRFREEDGYMSYVFKAKFEDAPSADAEIVFWVNRRPSNKQLLQVTIGRILRSPDDSSDYIYYYLNRRSLKRLDGDFFEELKRQCQVSEQKEKILSGKAGNSENTTKKKPAKSKSEDVYEYTGNYFWIVEEDGFSMEYHFDHFVRMKLLPRGFCCFDMEIGSGADHPFTLRFDGSAYPEKGAGWFKGLLNIREEQNRRSEMVYFYWEKNMEGWIIYDKSNEPVFGSDLKLVQHETN